MDAPTTTTDRDLSALDGLDDTAPREIASVPVQLSGGRVLAHCAMTTVHPQLVIVPEIDEGEFTGGFTLAHAPTGLVLDCSWHPAAPLTPAQAGYLAALLAHLDWASTNRDDYQGEHKRAWLDALNAVARRANASSGGDRWS
jgi:hypothetical protein